MDLLVKQIQFWAHMLDETKHQSYYDVYMAANPKDKQLPLIESLVYEFAEDLKRQHFNWKKLLGKNDKLNVVYLDNAQASLKYHYRWQVIPSSQYAAIVTRSTAAMDAAKGQKYLSELEYADVRRGVSRKTIEDCLDLVCHNTNVLEANNRIVSQQSVIANDDQVSRIFQKNGLPKILRDRYGDLTTSDYFAVVELYKAWASYAEGDMGEKYICDSDNGPAQLKKVLKDCEYDADDAQLVATLSKAIDVAHFRSDLALAFVEGGQRTCAIVSNLPDKFVV